MCRFHDSIILILLYSLYTRKVALFCCFRCFNREALGIIDLKRQSVSGDSHKLFKMAAVSLALNGCDEIENLLKFCEIPRERIRVEETKELSSSKVWVFEGTIE